MKTKFSIPTAWLIFFTCWVLAPLHCAKEEPKSIPDEAAVIQAVRNLTIGYDGIEDAEGVTEDITLPAMGMDDSGEGNQVTITWMSENPKIINVETPGTGVITQPRDVDTGVTLTATLAKNDISDAKTWTLTVLADTASANEDINAVAQATRNLEIGYASGDSAGSVTQDVSLPTAGKDGVAISWASSHADLIDPKTGRVTRSNSNTDVTLTATLTKNAARDIKTFALTVIIRPFVWSQVDLANGASIWFPRTGHTTVMFNNKMWVLGGANGTNYYNDVWWSTDGASWTNANARGPTEGDGHWSNRQNHAVVVFDSKMWVLGGNNGSRKDDVWWSSDGTSWTNANASGHWSARDNHAVVVFDSKMWVLGGNDGSRKDDVWWSSDGITWTNANASGHWSARLAHTVVVLDNKMWVLGGNGGGNQNDVWWSSDGATWTDANASGHWSARGWHTSVVFDNKMWVLGGHDGGRKNDVWWSSDGTTWTNTNAREHWSPRSGYAAVAFDEKMWVLGGEDGNRKNDVWAANK